MINNIYYLGKLLVTLQKLENLGRFRQLLLHFLTFFKKPFTNKIIIMIRLPLKIVISANCTKVKKVGL
jgi:hypothetical protein